MRGVVARPFFVKFVARRHVREFEDAVSPTPFAMDFFLFPFFFFLFFLFFVKCELVLRIFLSFFFFAVVFGFRGGGRESENARAWNRDGGTMEVWILSSSKERKKEWKGG